MIEPRMLINPIALVLVALAIANCFRR